MSRLFSIAILGFLCLSAVAQESVVTKIFSLESATEKSPFTGVLSIADGRVYRLPAGNEAARKGLLLAMRSGSLVKLTLEAGDSFSIREVEVIDANTAVNSAFADWERSRAIEKATAKPARERHLWSYRPTVLESDSDAKSLFRSEHPYKRGVDLNDNCFNRAHFWTRSFEKNSQVKSQKAFVLFTARYRREHNYKWWYHVAPMVLVDSGESRPSEVVLDPSFTSGPLSLDDWSLEFAEKAKSCKRGRSISDYYSNDEIEECLVITANMYYYTPNELDGADSISEWRCSDLRNVQRALPPPGVSSWDEVEDFMPKHCK